MTILWLWYDYVMTMTYHWWQPGLMVQCCRDWLCCPPGERGGGPGGGGGGTASLPPPPPPRPHHPGYLNMNVRGEKTERQAGQHVWPLNIHCATGLPSSPLMTTSPGDLLLLISPGREIIFIIYHQAQCGTWLWLWKLIKYLEVNDEARTRMMVAGCLSADRMTSSPLSLLPRTTEIINRMFLLPWEWAGATTSTN